MFTKRTEDTIVSKLKYTRSGFDYEINKELKLLMIRDNNLGMSVTNDIENVIEYIKANEESNLDNYKCIYQDSEGNWDGWDIQKQKFILLNTNLLEIAIDKINL